MKTERKNLKYFDKIFPALGILLASIFVCIPLLCENINIYVDDGIQHICRLIGTEQMIKSGQFLPMIMSNFCNNFGYSWNVFYSPLTAYLPLIFRIFNFTFENCLKIFMFVIALASGISMYKFTLKITNNCNIATLAACLYILAPYRITDMYMRVAISELFSFVFIPMVFDGLYTTINKNEKTWLLVIGASGLMLTHTVICMYTAILSLIYVIVFIKKLNRKNIKYLILNLIIILLVTSFFWVGLIQHYFATSYEVFVPGRMERIDVLESLKVEFKQLFSTKKDSFMIYEIGLITVIGILLSPINVVKMLKNEDPINSDNNWYLLFLLLGIILTFMTLTIFPFEKLPKIFTMLQFSFRLLEFSAFFLSFVAAVNYGMLIKNFKKTDVIILITISMLLMVPYINMLHYDKTNNEDELINPRRVTTQTGRVHAGMASLEYLPSKAFNCLKTYVAKREDEPIILNSSNFEMKSYIKNGSNMQVTFEKNSTASEYTKIDIELPYIYYLGYRVKLNGKNIKYMESENGFVLIKADSENDEINIEVKYTGTNLMIISFFVSICTVGLLIVYTIIYKRKQKMKV